MNESDLTKEFLLLTANDYNIETRIVKKFFIFSESYTHLDYLLKLYMEERKQNKNKFRGSHEA